MLNVLKGYQIASLEEYVARVLNAHKPVVNKERCYAAI